MFDLKVMLYMGLTWPVEPALYWARRNKYVAQVWARLILLSVQCHSVVSIVVNGEHLLAGGHTHRELQTVIDQGAT